MGRFAYKVTGTPRIFLFHGNVPQMNFNKPFGLLLVKFCYNKRHIDLILFIARKNFNRVGWVNMKCHHCNSFDSMLRHIYVDKNNNLVTESERTAFEVLHPEEKGNIYTKIVLCGICYEQLSKQTNRVFPKKRPLQTTSPKGSSIRKPQNYYICPFCKTANEPMRNTCKNCGRILFSTEYETKRVPSKSLKGHERKNFNFKKGLVPIIVLLAIAFFASRGTEVRQKDVATPTRQVIQNETVSGQSSYKWSDGTKYTGEFKGGRPHGKGTITWANGQTYTGDFFQGQMTGYGTLKLTDGSAYTGNFYNGKPHGQGTMNYSDGSVYTGNWVNGERE